MEAYLIDRLVHLAGWPAERADGLSVTSGGYAPVRG
jgi:hypothetical protein